MIDPLVQPLVPNRCHYVRDDAVTARPIESESTRKCGVNLLQKPFARMNRVQMMMALGISNAAATSSTLISSTARNMKTVRCIACGGSMRA